MSLVNLPNELRAKLGLVMKLKKVIHVGANTGQEVSQYEGAGIEGYHVEAHPDYFAQVARRCDQTSFQTAIEACCDSVAGRIVEFKVASNMQSSSMLPLGRHAVAYPHIVITDTIQLTTTTLDILVGREILPRNADFLLLDVQGAEDRVLAGAKELLSSGSLWGIQVEASLDALYDGGAIFEEVYVTYLKPQGYFLKSADFNRHGWTDALFLKRWWLLPGETVSPLRRASELGSTEPI